MRSFCWISSPKRWEPISTIGVSACAGHRCQEAGRLGRIDIPAGTTHRFHKVGPSPVHAHALAFPLERQIGKTAMTLASARFLLVIAGVVHTGHHHRHAVAARDHAAACRGHPHPEGTSREGGAACCPASTRTDSVMSGATVLCPAPGTYCRGC